MSDRLAHILSGKHDALIQRQLEEARVAKAAKTKAAIKARMDKNPVFRAAMNCRRRFSAALRAQRVQKTSKFVLRFFGCTVEKFREHIEAQFLPGMEWANYGSLEVDHVRPMAVHDLRDPEQQLASCHYTNLAPLWKEDNRKKSYHVKTRGAARFKRPKRPNWNTATISYPAIPAPVSPATAF